MGSPLVGSHILHKRVQQPPSLGVFVGYRNMGNVVQLNQIGILEHAASATPSQIVLYETCAGGIRWYNPPAERALKRLSSGLTMRLHDVMHREEAESWILEGQLVLKSGHCMEYVEHIGYVGDDLVSSRSGVWERLEEPLSMKQLAYIQVSAASVRKQLVMRLTLPLDKLLQLAEEYMTEAATGRGTATLAGK